MFTAHLFGGLTEQEVWELVADELDTNTQENS